MVLVNSMFERVRRDLARCFTFESRTGTPSLLEKLKIVATNHALKGILVYRFGAWVRTVPNPALNLPLKAVYRTLDELVTLFWAFHIHSTADIDGGLYIAHPYGVLIGPTTMGMDCNVGAGVTIGIRPGGVLEESIPTIGERVFIGPGSIVFGGITIAEGTAVGPLTVVGRNLPPRCLAVGNPMQIVRRNFDNQTLIYGTRPPPTTP
jgi:serine O-acetyltransferase